jgi:hypothetical protein
VDTRSGLDTGEKKNLLSLPGIKPPHMMGMKIVILEISLNTQDFYPINLPVEDMMYPQRYLGKV